MGWTTLHRDKGTTNADFFFGAESGRTVHAHGTVHGVFYAAVESSTNPGEVWAFVALTSWAPNAYHNFGYKDMDETCGPGVFQAPQNVLDALTPTEHTTALWWRDKCAAHQAQRKALRGLQDGDQIVLSQPLRFTNGAEIDTFAVAHRGGRSVGLSHGGLRYRVPHWQDTVVAVTRAGTTHPTPLALRGEENAYVRSVEVLRHVDREAVESHYGTGAYASADAEWCARQEFRSGERWARLAEHETAAQPA